MSANEAIKNIRENGLHAEADFLVVLIHNHQKEHSAAIACLRQMDKVNAENARLREEISKAKP